MTRAPRRYANRQGHRPNQASPPTHEGISIHDRLDRAISTLCTDASRALGASASSLASVLHSLSHYLEEGRELFPDLLLTPSLRPLLRSVPDVEYVAVGVTPMSDEAL